MSKIGSDVEYCKAWAEMMVNIWVDRVIQYGLRDTGALLSSFKQNIVLQSGGNVAKMIFAFLYYGRMVAMGVHKGQTIENRMLDNVKSKPRDWYTKPLYHSLLVLNEKRAQMYGEEFKAIIIDTLKS
jgi:hypothetical protein